MKFRSWISIITIVTCLPVASLLSAQAIGVTAQSDFDLRDGDVVFQTSQAVIGPALEIALQSNVTHCGVVFYENDTAFVYEAVGPVRKVPFDEWTRIGKDSLFCVKRLEDDDSAMSHAVRDSMLSIFSGLEGRPYDITFQWSDSMIYCSELVYKMYKRGAGIELGKVERFGDFNLENDTVQYFIKMYFREEPNLEEPVVTPVSLYEDRNLVTVFSNMK